jgi:hypothetical protein
LGHQKVGPDVSEINSFRQGAYGVSCWVRGGYWHGLFHIVHVEIAPSPIQAESKFSQAGPSPRKDHPRKRLGFPWIPLSELSLFKDLRGPPGPENIFGSSLPFRSTELERHMRRRALAMRRSSLAPRRPM